MRDQPIPPSVILWVLLAPIYGAHAGCSKQPPASPPPPARTLDISPMQQAPGLCGVASGEMVLRFYGVEKLGASGQYRISDASGGSALGQLVCDRIAQGRAGTTLQPRCAAPDGAPLPVYAGGLPTDHTRRAYPKGTFLPNVQAIWREHGITSVYTRSVAAADNTYAPERVGPRADALIDLVRRGHPAIIHVTPRRTRGGGHYLLMIGYDDPEQALIYIDPNPVGDDPAIDRVAYDDLRSGAGWFRDGYFFTGRYLAVTEAPKR